MRSSPERDVLQAAIMFRSVDLPQPDGPTRMTNSPSAMSRSTSWTAEEPSGYRLGHLVQHDLRHDVYPFTAPEVSPDTMPALEEQHEHDDRDGDDDAPPRDRQPGRVLELRGTR